MAIHSLCRARTGNPKGPPRAHARLGHGSSLQSGAQAAGAVPSSFACGSVVSLFPMTLPLLEPPKKQSKTY